MAKAKGAPKTGGRKKGTPNKLTQSVKAALMAAFEEAGGQAYLLSVAQTDPRTFCTLLGKAMPTEIAGDAENPLQMRHKIVFEVVDPSPKG